MNVCIWCGNVISILFVICLLRDGVHMKISENNRKYREKRTTTTIKKSVEEEKSISEETSNLYKHSHTMFAMFISVLLAFFHFFPILYLCFQSNFEAFYWCFSIRYIIAKQMLTSVHFQSQKHIKKYIFDIISLSMCVFVCSFSMFLPIVNGQIVYYTTYNIYLYSILWPKIIKHIW